MENFYQAKELIQKSQNILISLPQEISEDKFWGALALFYTLRELGKKVNLASFWIFKKLKFLIDEEFLESPNQNSNSIIISIDTKKGKIDKIHYEKNSQELKFSLDLKEGEVEIEKVTFKAFEEPDLTITINGKDLIFESRKLLYNQKVIIQDFSGNILKTIKNFLGVFNENLINREVITYLLSGEVSLFNQVISKLNFHEDKKIAWCLLSREDFKKTNSSSRDLAFVFKTLKLNFSLPETIFILWEDPQSSHPSLIKGVIFSLKKELIEKILEKFEGVFKDHKAIFLLKDNNLKEAEEKILNIIYGTTY